MKKIIVIISIVVLVILLGLITVVFSFSNHKFDLNSTPKTTAAPSFSFDNAIKGFTDVNRTGSQTNKFTFARYLSDKSDNECQAILQTTYLAANNSGAGDQYLSKYSLSQLASNNSHVKYLNPIYIDTASGDKLEFDTASYSTIQQISSGTSRSNTVTSSHKIFTYIAVRAIDKEYANPSSSNISSSQAATMGKSGLPILTVQYQCTDQSVSSSTWQELISQAKINLK